MKRDDSPLPAHQMKAGDEAEVHDPQHVSSKPHEGSTSGKDKSSDSHRISGVVSKVTPTSIDFVCDDAPGDEGSTSWLLSSSSLRLDMRSSEATHKKLTAALDGLLSVASKWCHSFLYIIQHYLYMDNKHEKLCGLVDIHNSILTLSCHFVSSISWTEF